MPEQHLTIRTEPDVRTVAGRVSAIRRRAPDVTEVRIAPARPLTYLPGQYLWVQFRGLPTRCYNPTAPMEDFSEPEFLYLHVRRIRHGRVSSAIVGDIREGHPVRLTGPFGTAFLRPAGRKRLVLVARDTGFAAAWSIAVAALHENRYRHIVMAVGAPTLQSLYMVNALCMLARFPNVTVIPVVETPQRVPDVIRIGDVADYVPELSPDDSVYVSGPLPLVEAVGRMAAAARAPCYSNPFLPQQDDEPDDGWWEEKPRGSALSRALDWLGGGRRTAAQSKGGGSRVRT